MEKDTLLSLIKRKQERVYSCQSRFQDEEYYQR